MYACKSPCPGIIDFWDKTKWLRFDLLLEVMGYISDTVTAVAVVSRSQSNINVKVYNLIVGERSRALYVASGDWKDTVSVLYRVLLAGSVV